MKNRVKSALFLAFSMAHIFCGSLCAEEQAKKIENPSLVLVNPQVLPQFIDDGDLKGLRASIEQSLIYYSRLPLETTFLFGAETYSLERIIQSLSALKELLNQSQNNSKLNRFIRDRFLIYRSRGSDPDGLVHYTAYYEHTLRARLSPTAEYRYALYARPSDLVDVLLENFDPKKRGERIVGRPEGRNLAPYYTREEIDSKKILSGKGLEIAWANNPMDILFLQIQGSGWIEVPDSAETYHIRYAGDNGRPFRSVGSYLIEKGLISKQEFSRGRMVQYLSQLPEEERQKILNENPRYIFFEIQSPTVATRGSLLVSLTPGRSIASDPKFYPPGALAWIQTEQPAFDQEGKVVGTKKLQRFVLNQDEGGAIKGTGRIDFFTGRGKDAQRMAEKMWYSGDLYFFILKP